MPDRAKWLGKKAHFGHSMRAAGAWGVHTSVKGVQQVAAFMSFCGHGFMLYSRAADFALCGWRSAECCAVHFHRGMYHLLHWPSPPPSAMRRSPFIEVSRIAGIVLHRNGGGSVKKCEGLDLQQSPAILRQSSAAPCHTHHPHCQAQTLIG